MPFIVDDEDSFGLPAPRLRIAIDQNNLEFHKVEQSDVYDTLQTYLGGATVGYSHRGGGRHPVEIAVQLPKAKLALNAATLATPVPANALPGERSIVELGDVVDHDREVVGVGEQVLLEPRRERRQVLVVVAQPSLLGLVEAGTRDRVLHVVALDQVA